MAVDAWRRNYAQLDILFTDVTGFEEFMVTIANNTLPDSIYGTVYRVTIGAILSIADALADLYTISTYYQSDELKSQSNALLAIIATNLSLQIILLLILHRKKDFSKKKLLREIAITLFFFRPAVDAYRVSTNYRDSEIPVENLLLVRFVCKANRRLAKRSDEGRI